MVMTGTQEPVGTRQGSCDAILNPSAPAYRTFCNRCTHPSLPIDSTGVVCFYGGVVRSKNARRILAKRTCAPNS